MVESKLIRQESSSIAAKAGINIPANLPLLDEKVSLRSVSEGTARLLSLTAIGATSYGFDKAKAREWLKQEKLVNSLTMPESDFLLLGKGAPKTFQIQIEAMWAIAWALGFVGELNFWKDCDNRFATMLPNLKTSQSGEDWRRRAKMRTVNEVFSACDLAYCLHWAVRQAQLEGKIPPGQLKAYVVEERRRALEWLLSDCSWDAVNLDT